MNQDERIENQDQEKIIDLDRMLESNSEDSAFMTDSDRQNNPSSTKKPRFTLSSVGSPKFQQFMQDHFIIPFKRYIGLVEKEIRILLNDKAAMLITFGIPIIIILILTVGMNDQWITNDTTETQVNASDLNFSVLPRVGLLDMDDSEGFPGRDLSQELVQMFVESEERGECYLYIATNQSDLEWKLGVGELNTFVIIPRLFEFNLSIHLPTILPYVVDSIDINSVQSSQMVVDAIIQEFRNDNDFKGVFKSNVTNVNLPEDSQTLFAALPLFVPLILFGIGCLVATQAIVSDIPKDRMVLTPTNKHEMFLAKVTGNQFMMIIVSMIILVTSALVNLQIRSSWFSYFVVMFILSLNAVMLGVSISAISKTPLAAFQYFIFFFLFMMIASLFIEDETLLAMLPLHNGRRLVLNVVLRGQSFWSAREYILNILYETFVIYVISFLIFQKQKTML